MPNTVADSTGAAFNPGSNDNWLHVVAAVIVDAQAGAILLARRPETKHQGGKWEFPGGKVEPTEAPVVALQRELDEELGIVVAAGDMSQFIEVRHRYPDKNIFLEVWQVSVFTGRPYGREGQEVRWFLKQDLAELAFPAANVPILDKLLA